MSPPQVAAGSCLGLLCQLNRCTAVPSNDRSSIAAQITRSTCKCPLQCYNLMSPFVSITFFFWGGGGGGVDYFQVNLSVDINIGERVDLGHSCSFCLLMGAIKT